jgi:hypothetical protein
VVKFSENHEEMTDEINILIKLGKTKSKLFGKNKNGLVPKIVNYGTIVMENILNDPKNNCSNNEILVIYAIMKQCQTPIGSYFSHQKSIEPLDIIDIII